jgi:hypothetical protein
MNLTRRDLRWMPLAAPFASLAQRKSPTNVLVIAVGELNNRIGCYGDPVVREWKKGRLHHGGARQEFVRPQRAHRPVSIFEWDAGKSGIELYDHETDVNEWTNLAGNNKAAAVQRELHELLRAQKSNLPPRS